MLCPVSFFFCPVSLISNHSVVPQSPTYAIVFVVSTGRPLVSTTCIFLSALVVIVVRIYEFGLYNICVTVLCKRHSALFSMETLNSSIFEGIGALQHVSKTYITEYNVTFIFLTLNVLR